MKIFTLIIAFFCTCSIAFAQDLTPAQSKGLQTITDNMCGCASKLFVNVSPGVQVAFMKVTTMQTKEDYQKYLEGLSAEQQQELVKASTEIQGQMGQMKGCVNASMAEVKNLFTAKEIADKKIDGPWLLNKMLVKMQSKNDCAFTRFVLEMAQKRM